MAPTTFKITTAPPNSITRRFTSPTSTPSWSELETRIRSLFRISPLASIGLTYIDEDGDTITVSSDAELQEIYEAQQLQAERDEESRQRLKELQENFNNRNEITGDQESIVSSLGGTGSRREGASESEAAENISGRAENSDFAGAMINSGNKLTKKFGLVISHEPGNKKDDEVENEEIPGCLQQ
ncbi:11905_t:CDS:1 [Acaulospora colombiana]|uniref:11905_t:CDS:1 n=1 Tax=Acaulospora colombiana TaxID=27376 RepID=A0ACA9K9C4_9GLOM|nr:11905_t:CDS:1 [Acaulospora colombiana]